MSTGGHPIEPWRHEHAFNLDNREGERRTRLVVILTACMMVVEIAAGYLFGSMALLADGWHMATHVAALSIAVFAYRYARRNADNPAFSFGTGKVTALGGFASAAALAVVAMMMGLESIARLIAPETIRFDEAILVAVIGLVVNLVSAWLLHGGELERHHGYGLDHHHDHDEHGGHHHHDHNLRAAYLHVLADALTSLLAIVALVAGKFFGWIWLDACMGLVGAALITRWAWSLVGETSTVLLDSSPDEATLSAVRKAIESDADNQVADLHVWRLGPRDLGAIISLVTHHPREPEHYKALLGHMPELVHVTVEVNRCREEKCSYIGIGEQAGHRAEI
jgi:cation diffusion facilitator family transporter